MKPLLLRLHRWISLAFALPLAVVIVTGLILSFEPILQVAGVKPGSVTVSQVEAVLAKADPEGKATGLAVRSDLNAVTVGGGPGGRGRTVDLATGEPVATGGLSVLFGASRGIHERLVFDLGWLVIASTIAMMVIVALGVAMGLPRIRNTVSGWHKATAWFLLPLVVLSPLTGLAIAFGITFAAPTARPAATPSLVEAVRMVGADHDLAAVQSIRKRGPVMMARIWEGGELRAYALGRDGAVAMDRNWPRLIHEGNGAGIWGGLANVITSIALMILLGTGLFIWARRTLRPRQRQRTHVPA